MLLLLDGEPIPDGSLVPSRCGCFDFDQDVAILPVAAIEQLMRDARLAPNDFARLFAGAPDTLMYKELQRGRLSYRMYHFVKD